LLAENSQGNAVSNSAQELLKENSHGIAERVVKLHSAIK
jgi:hypothetical protein